MNNKYFKIDDKKYIIINKDKNTKLIKNKLTELEEKLEKNSIEKEKIINIETKRKDIWIFSIISHILFFSIIGTLCYMFCHTLLKTILVSIIPCLFASACIIEDIQKMYPYKTGKKENLNNLLTLETEREKLTKEIQELQDILSKLNLQEIKIERVNTPIKPMKQSNTKHKPIVRKLTNDKTRKNNNINK